MRWHKDWREIAAVFGLGPLGRCKEGEGMLVYWCVTHGCEWRYDKYPTCPKGKPR